MEPRNFSSPDATEKSREARLNKLRERRAKAVTSNSDAVLQPINSDSKTRMTRSPETMRSPEPIIDRFSNRTDSRGEGRDSKIKSLPNRNGREARPEQRLESRPENRTENRPENRTDNNTELRNTELRNTELRTRRKPNNPSRPAPVKSPVKSFGWQLLRLAIAGIGLSVITGTALSFWQNQQTIRAKSMAPEIVTKEETSKTSQDIAPLELKTEATALLAKIKELAAKEKDLTMQMMIVDLDSGTYVQLGANQPIAAASTIKTPILVAFFQDVDAGKIKLDEQLEMTADVKVGQAGELQYLPTGTKISALETATKMIVISDNTATNMIIKRLGGAVALNQRFKSWGLNSIVINNQLPDLEGTNTISTQDLATLLSMIDRGKLIEPRSRDRFMDIMRRPVTNTLLPQGIGEDARIIHKTGDIASSVGDAGIVDMPNGKRYAIAVMVKRPDNDQRANELIRQISRATYEYFLNGGKLPSSNQNPPTTGADAPNAANSNSANNSVNNSGNAASNPSNTNNAATSTIESIPLPLPNANPNNVSPVPNNSR
ncbi:serine hydrolase [Pseudanabaena sp. 'Roaring Creek']|uniref:serine hydrolase n=1 Tax=Pseudanabaena sp. 'Roaring Creek' TaxID=1681830 RepID=UPI0006D8272E|nr:serine hydrolase [Pseudanabaena sp. 'Roaring Creek']